MNLSDILEGKFQQIPVKKPGFRKLEEIPAFIREAAIFSAEELRALATVEQLPTPSEIDAFRYNPEIQDLTNAFIGDPDTRGTHQLLLAKEFLQQGKVVSAWKIALL